MLRTRLALTALTSAAALTLAAATTGAPAASTPPAAAPTGHHDHARGHDHAAVPAVPHGDRLPAGLDPDAPVDTDSLYRRAGLTPPAGAGHHPRITAHAAADGSPLPTLAQHVAPSCSGPDDRHRVQVLYVREASQPDRYQQMVPLLLDEIATVDDIFAVSAAKTGGGRRVRWVHDTDCVPVIDHVTVPDGFLKAGFNATTTALTLAGYARPDRKYLAFSEDDGAADGPGFCGRGTLYLDSSAENNTNDGQRPMYGVVYVPCWNTAGAYSTAAHELGHNLGAVHPDAPNASAALHCTDEADLMCYQDGPDVTMQLRCPDTGHDGALLDCGNDDYFHTDPDPGSWLATHWNTANSRFLDTVPALAPPTVRVLPSTGRARTGTTVTFTAHTGAPAARYQWRTSQPGCSAGPTDGAFLRIRCDQHHTGQVTVAVTVIDGDGLTGTGSAVVAYDKAARPTVTVGASAGRVPGKAARLVARTGGRTDLSYDWSLTHGPGRCRLVGTGRAVGLRCPSRATRTVARIGVWVTAADGQQAYAATRVTLLPRRHH